jgi:sugar lactone lactonase YvrE
MSTIEPTIRTVRPVRAIEGGRLTIEGSNLPVDGASATLNGQPARIRFASPSRLVVAVPAGLDGGEARLRLDRVPGEILVSIGSVWATGLHQVDNPLFDAEGHLFVTYSGSRGQETLVSLFRVTRDGAREPFASGIVNATSMAIGPEGALYVSSRFEGAVYRVDAAGRGEQVASDLGVACGLAFDADGWLYVGDRSGTIFRVRDGRARAFASVPPSVAAFHLAMSPAQELYVSAPTLGTCDPIYRVSRHGDVQPLPVSFGRPQGLAFSPDGVLHVVDALAGSSALYRLPREDGPPELVVSAGALVGVAFGPGGELVVASNDTAYGF